MVVQIILAVLLLLLLWILLTDPDTPPEEISHSQAEVAPSPHRESQSQPAQPPLTEVASLD